MSYLTQEVKVIHRESFHEYLSAIEVQSQGNILESKVSFVYSTYK